MMKSERLLSLDVLRGLTIIGMIVVNSPGSWSHVFTPLLHASWNGATPTDLVFPFFLFIMGVSISLAYTHRLAIRTPRAKLTKKILVRGLKLFALGLFLNLWPDFDFGEMRVAGVLQRIAVVFVVCAVLFLNTRWKQQLWIGAGILVGYWGLLSLIPVPLDEVNASALESGYIERSHGTRVAVVVEPRGDSFLKANLEPGTNLAAWIDRKLLPGSFWERAWDPEGLASTLPAVATGIFGMLMGVMIQGIGDPYRRVSWVFFIGFLAVVIGSMWGWVFPLNKNLWSSSFVLYSGGWASLSLATCILVVDIFGYRRWAKPALVFGANAVVAYALSGILISVFYAGYGDFTGLSALFMRGAGEVGIPLKLASLLYALLYVGVLYLPVRWLWSRRIFVKL